MNNAKAVLLIVITGVLLGLLVYFLPAVITSKTKVISPMATESANPVYMKDINEAIKNGSLVPME